MFLSSRSVSEAFLFNLRQRRCFIHVKMLMVKEVMLSEIKEANWNKMLQNVSPFQVKSLTI